MLYVLKDSTGAVVAVSKTAMAGFVQTAPHDFFVRGSLPTDFMAELTRVRSVPLATIISIIPPDVVSAFASAAHTDQTVAGLYNQIFSQGYINLDSADLDPGLAYTQTVVPTLTSAMIAAIKAAA